ncbi:MAG: discoidin domain-containing protein, partial [Gemmatimonadaceae bacterium]
CAAAVSAQQPVAAAVPRAGVVVVDAFDSVAQWTAVPADGVEISVHPDSGGDGRSMRIDFDFHGHGGYAVVRRAVNLALPANYEFSFAIRGNAPINTLEFKLADSTGENVWWSNTPGFVFPREWSVVTRKKRHISFAWGPTADRELRRVFAIELAITAGSGGKGSVWIDDLTLTPLDPAAPYTLVPAMTATASATGFDIRRASDADPETSWRYGGTAPATIEIDFHRRREFGGLVLDWSHGRRAKSYDVLGSVDGIAWQKLYSVNRTSPAPASTLDPRDYIHVPESDARYLRIVLNEPESANGYGIRELSVKPLEWAPTKNDLMRIIAGDSPRGTYPRYLSGEQSYWTVIGVDGAAEEALINEEGMIEVGRGRFSIEPFLHADDKLFTWNDARITVLPDSEALPFPQVKWTVETRRGDLELLISAFATGPADSSMLHVRYRVTDLTDYGQNVQLYLALRPLQVNPPWQFLNKPGGIARVDTLEMRGRDILVDGNNVGYFFFQSFPDDIGAASFDDGDIVTWLRAGAVPAAKKVVDPLGLASAALRYNVVYDVDLRPGSVADSLEIAVPLTGPHGEPSWAISFEARAQAERALWREKLGRVRIELPSHAFRHTRTLRANLAYILVNRDGPAIQPGSRSYSRSWIRDGSLTSTALLRMGHAPVVKEFIEWYATHQYDNGKVPCCVDEQGATPVPENDSHGQFIYLVAEYFRHTGDTTLLRGMWPHVAKAVSYMDSLRQSRMTEQYRSGTNRVFYGLMPESISHEGYSAKPMHSYWDDFFALRGFKDATFIARVLRRPEADGYARITASFRTDVTESIRRVMSMRGIDFIPGSAELADFDATSTTVAVSPLGEGTQLFPEALQHTFDRYFAEARARADGTKAYEAYTPYELRTVGTFVQLGQRAKAHELLDFFFRDQRPAAWYQWAEVVFRDPKAPRFIGDMPHTWVGSDYIRSFLDMLAFERESDSSLVITAGVKAQWLKEEPGVRVTNLSTHYGPLSYDARMSGNTVTLNVRSGIRMPPGGVVVPSPLDARVLSAVVNGSAAEVHGHDVVVRKLPATVTIRYGR